MRKLSLKMTLCVLGAAALWVPAEARRTTVDGGGSETLSGYCDLDGLDCTPIALGYSVDFGSGAVSSVLHYGNGLISFGPTALDPLAYSSSLADFGGIVVAPGLNNETTTDFFGPDPDGEVFEQSATLSLLPDGSIHVDFFYSDFPGSYFPRYSADLAKQADGYLVTFTYDDAPSTPVAGYSVPGVATVNNATEPFLIHATFSNVVNPDPAVPEPATWASMVAGFGLLGVALRARRRRIEVQAV